HTGHGSRCRSTGRTDGSIRLRASSTYPLASEGASTDGKPSGSFAERRRSKLPLSSSCRKMLHVARHGHPFVHRLLPDRSRGSLEIRISTRTTRCSDHGWVLASPCIYGRAASRAEE